MFCLEHSVIHKLICEEHPVQFGGIKKLSKWQRSFDFQQFHKSEVLEKEGSLFYHTQPFVMPAKLLPFPKPSRNPIVAANPIWSHGELKTSWHSVSHRQKGSSAPNTWQKPKIILLYLCTVSEVFVALSYSPLLVSCDLAFSFWDKGFSVLQILPYSHFF